MGMIFDSCIWVALAANQLDRQAVIEIAGDAPVFTSVISRGEFEFWRARLYRPRRARQARSLLAPG